MFADDSSVVATRSTVISSQSIEFDFGLDTFVLADESNVVGKKSTCHQ